ncbi:MAG TPA: hypothetical protein EYP85_17235 [Armatimonadetes bacterium]|nr:hypothetical protein [Armatimonadota bacterium]
MASICGLPGLRPRPCLRCLLCWCKPAGEQSASGQVNAPLPPLLPQYEFLFQLYRLPQGNNHFRTAGLGFAQFHLGRRLGGEQQNELSVEVKLLFGPLAELIGLLRLRGPEGLYLFHLARLCQFNC